VSVTHDASSVRSAQLLQHERRGGGCGRSSSAGVDPRFQEPRTPTRVRQTADGATLLHWTGSEWRPYGRWWLLLGRIRAGDRRDDGATPAGREKLRGKVDLTSAGDGPYLMRTPNSAAHDQHVQREPHRRKWQRRQHDSFQVFRLSTAQPKSRAPFMSSMRSLNQLEGNGLESIGTRTPWVVKSLLAALRCGMRCSVRVELLGRISAVGAPSAAAGRCTESSRAVTRRSTGWLSDGGSGAPKPSSGGVALSCCQPSVVTRRSSLPAMASA
jgi:hypothetical protein